MTILNLPLKASSDDRTISEASGSILADVWWHDDTPNNKWDADAKARAAEIVRRVNLHDELVEALQAAENFIVGFEDDDMQEGIPELLAQIRAAIARQEAR